MIPDDLPNPPAERGPFCPQCSSFDVDVITGTLGPVIVCYAEGCRARRYVEPGFDDDRRADSAHALPAFRAFQGAIGGER